MAREPLATTGKTSAAMSVASGTIFAEQPNYRAEHLGGSREITVCGLSLACCMSFRAVRPPLA